jgi:hypothetical protein
VAAARLTAACAALQLAACAGALDDPGRFADLGGDAGLAPDGGPACDPVADLFVPTCATAFCHSTQSKQGHLDLAAPGLPHRLVGVTANGGPGVLIDPQEPAASVLARKLTDSPPFGLRMPLGLPPLTADQQGCLAAWLAAAR